MHASITQNDNIKNTAVKIFVFIGWPCSVDDVESIPENLRFPGMPENLFSVFLGVCFGVTFEAETLKNETPIVHYVPSCNLCTRLPVEVISFDNL